MGFVEMISGVSGAKSNAVKAEDWSACFKALKQVFKKDDSNKGQDTLVKSKTSGTNKTTQDKKAEENKTKEQYTEYKDGKKIVYQKVDDEKAKKVNEENLKQKGVNTEKDKKYVNVQSWSENNGPKDDMKPNNCLERIAMNYKPEDMSLNDAMELIMNQNPKIYDSNRGKTGGDTIVDTTLYTDEKVYLPNDWFKEEPIYEVVEETDIEEDANKIDSAKVADELYNAMKGCGTDEDTVINYISVNGKNALADDELKEVMQAYHDKYHEPLYNYIDHDFSNSDKDLLLARINNVSGGVTEKYNNAKTDKEKQEIIQDKAEKLHDAMYKFGTDEIVLFEVLQLDKDLAREIIDYYNATYSDADGKDFKTKADKELSHGYQKKLDELYYNYLGYEE